MATPSELIPPAYADDIYAGRVQLLRRQMPTVLGAIIIAATLLVIILWPMANSLLLILWLLANYVLALTRWQLLRQFDRSPPTGAAVKRWARLFILLSAVSGLIWGAPGILFLFPDDPLYLAVLTMFLLGVTAAPLASLSVFPLAYGLFAAATMGQLSIGLFMLGEVQFYVLAFLALVFLGVSLMFSRLIHRTLIRSLVLRYENLDLVEGLKEQKEIAEQANIAKSRFLAAASHDLRQPLHALGLFINTLETQLHQSGYDDLFKKINSSVAALDDLFNAILDISKLDAGVVEVNPSHFQVGPMMEKIVNEFKPQAQEKGLYLHMESCAEVVKTDAVLLERIVRNLVSNAIRYTQRGVVKLACEPADSGVRIEVSDTGPGIPEEELENIFSEFHQLHNPERDRNKGLGLGLAIVRRLADLLRHPLLVDSSVGEGSVFCIDVPRGRAEDMDTREEFLIRPHWKLDEVFIVVIDDEEAIRDAMQTVLTGWGCEVLLADSLKEAMDQLQANERKPDLVISDYRLRENETGVEAIRSIQEFVGDEIPGILITGDTAPERLQEARSSGYHLLHKPVKPGQLRMVINRTLLQ